MGLMTPHLCSSTDVCSLAKKERVGSGWLHLITSDFFSFLSKSSSLRE